MFEPLRGWQLPCPTVALSALSLYQLVQTTTFQVPGGIRSAVSARVGQQLGGGSPVRARQAFRCGLALAACWLPLPSSLLLTLADTWGRLFTDDGSVVAALRALTPLLVTYVAFDAVLAIANGALAGCGLQKVGGRLALFSYVCLSLPCALVLAFGADAGAAGVTAAAARAFNLTLLTGGVSRARGLGPFRGLAPPLGAEESVAPDAADAAACGAAAAVAGMRGLAGGHLIGKATHSSLSLLYVMLRVNWRAESERAVARIARLSDAAVHAASITKPAAAEEAAAGAVAAAEAGGASSGSVELPTLQRAAELVAAAEVLAEDEEEVVEREEEDEALDGESTRHGRRTGRRERRREKQERAGKLPLLT